MTTPQPDKLFDRIETDSGWQYTDPDEQALLVVASMNGFDLIAFDTFLEGEWAGPAAQGNRDYLLAKRRRALQALRGRNQPLMQELLESLFNSWRRYRREDFLLPLAQQGKSHSESQSQRAQKPRDKLGDGDTGLQEAIANLAREHPEEGAKALWLRFIGLLDAEGLNPEEVEIPGDMRSSRVQFDNPAGKKTRSLTFGSFQNKLTKARKKKSR